MDRRVELEGVSPEGRPPEGVLPEGMPPEGESAIWLVPRRQRLRSILGPILLTAGRVYLLVVLTLGPLIFWNSGTLTGSNLLRITGCLLVLLTAVCAAVSLGFAVARKLGLAAREWLELGLALPLVSALGTLGALAGKWILDVVAPGALATPTPRLLLFGLPIALLFALGLSHEDRLRRRLRRSVLELQAARRRELTQRQARDAAQNQRQLQERDPARQRRPAAPPALDAAEPLQRLGARVGDRILILPLADVTHFAAEDKVVFAHLASGRRHIVDKTLAELGEQLDPRTFVRVHRSTLVNVDHIRELQRWFGGRLRILLQDAAGTVLVASKSMAPGLKRVIFQ